MSGVQTKTVATEEANMRLDRWFRLHCPDLPFGRLQKILRTGEVRVDGKRAKTGQRLTPGQIIRIPPLGNRPPVPPTSSASSRPTISKKEAAFVRSLILYQDDDVLALNKPAGLAVQGGTGTFRHLDGLLDALRFEVTERPRLVHRLDRDTSGVLLLARNRAAAVKLGSTFKNRITRKIYWAVTVGVPAPEAGRIVLPLRKAGKPRSERMVVDSAEGKKAITDWRVLDHVGGRLALVALWPRTGRTHQLRVHLAELGTPILGDGKYGGRSAFPSGIATTRQLHLHAQEIDLPEGGPRLTAPLPPHMVETLTTLGLEAGADSEPFGKE